MAHGNPVKQQYLQCSHGHCLNHSPEWRNIGNKRLEHPGFFRKFWWSTWCCAKPMERYQEVQRQQCEKCGRQAENVIERYIAVCCCCGRKKILRSWY
jgi:hypothetical protein